MVTQMRIGVQNGMTNGHKIENRVQNEMTNGHTIGNRVQNGVTYGHTIGNQGSKRDDEWSQN